jgi:hypothetical protein
MGGGGGGAAPARVGGQFINKLINLVRAVFSLHLVSLSDRNKKSTNVVYTYDKVRDGDGV